MGTRVRRSPTNAHLSERPPAVGRPCALSAVDRSPSRAKRSDHGFTLVEMGVAMLIMAVFMVLIVQSMVHLVNPTLQTEAIRDSSNQLDIAFLDLDGEVRYASEIWQQYQGSPASDDNWDVVFESTYNGAPTPTCTELRYNWSSGQLTQSSWALGTPTTPTFKLLANDLTTTSDPFNAFDPVTTTGNTNYQKEQLTVTLSAASGTGPAHETTSSSVTFTALNSAGPTVTPWSSSTACYAAWTTA